MSKMYHVENNMLQPMLKYKLLSSSIIPRPVAWITSYNSEDGIINIAPFSFFNGAGMGVLTVAIMRNGYEMKDTARNILDTKEAVIHIVSKEIEEEMNQTAASLPKHISELERVNVNLVESNTVKVKAISEAKIRFETKLNQHVEIKDEDGFTITDLMILNVTDYYFDEEVFNPENLHVDFEKLNPIARLAGNNYATLSDSYVMVRSIK